MKVRDLKKQLECCDDNMEVVMNANNSCYVDCISKVITKLIAPFYDNMVVRKMLVITSDGQVGTIYS